eukprot:COSAG04_NODE_24308_length_323_cov_1.553571_1_plen_72_part_01
MSESQKVASAPAVVAVPAAQRGSCRWRCYRRCATTQQFLQLQHGRAEEAAAAGVAAERRRSTAQSACSDGGA